MNSWTWNEDQDTWLYGTRLDGCGVYEENGKFYGNIVVNNELITINGPFGIREEAFLESEKDFRIAQTYR